MSTKPPSSSTAPAAPSKQARSRKAATALDAAPTNRAGSAGGVVLSKEPPKKPISSSSTKTTKPSSASSSSAAAAATAAAAADSKEAQPKRKPRKLNKEPSTATKDGSSTLGPSTSVPSTSVPASVPSASTEAKELEALKSRVRGLEAKVEELYRSSPSVGVGAAGGAGAGAAARSPRRRGKGRKSSSATTTATLAGLARDGEKGAEGQAAGQVASLNDDEGAAEEELGRLQDELETARMDLALFHPSTPTPTSTPSSTNPRPRARRAPAEEEDGVEEVTRDRPGVERAGGERQVTLSGSYRIPLPASLDPQDVRTIQSGVAAARDVARGFLEQRRAGASTGAQGKGKTQRAQGGEGWEGLREGVREEGAKVGWGEWIGGYSVAISRAVRSIEHEAAMEAQRPGGGGGSGRAGGRGKRPGAKTALSGEQIEGLMG